MATTTSRSATGSPCASCVSRAGWYLISQGRNEAWELPLLPQKVETKQSRDAVQALDCFVALASFNDGGGLSSPPVKDHAGNDEHRRHCQHLRKRFRGGPFGGFLHVYPPKTWA